MEFRPRQVRPSELYGDFWLNGEPLSLRAEQGNVVLIDFWDFTDPASLRSVRYSQEWHERYGLLNLRVVGVHTPQFSFGKNPERVGDALKRIGIRFPVVMDNEGMIWRSYDNQVRPTRYLVDKDGFLRLRQEGTGGPDRFERSIQALLREAGIGGALPQPIEPAHVLDLPSVVSFPATADVKLGYLHGTPGNPEAYAPESTVQYEDPGSHLPGRFYAHGKWIQEREFFRFDGAAGEIGSITVRFEAAEVYAVLEAPQGRLQSVEVTLDGVPVSDERLGDDVRRARNGSAIVTVGVPRLYHLVRDREFAEHLLRLSTSGLGLRVYALSFVSTAVPEFLSRA